VNIILGSSGQLGAYILGNLGHHNSHLPDRREIQAWSDLNSDELRSEIVGLLRLNDVSKHFLFCAVGETNPSADPKTLNQVNFELPRKILEATLGLPIQIVTFGSVHELTDISNPYMDSKKKLFSFFGENSDAFQWTHFQLHTLYSDRDPHPHMLLGQIFNSLKLKQKLKMSSGLQIRQYHHVEDVIRIVLKELTFSSSCGLKPINGPETLSIGQLAKAIYAEFDSMGLLEIGNIRGDSPEIFEAEFKLSQGLTPLDFRKSIPGVISVFKKLLR
jgi:nucleoside-diphosphate-sugar epimerase